MTLRRTLIAILCDALKDEGHALDPERLMQVEMLARSLPPDAPPERLRALLAPLFSTDPASQRRFYELFARALDSAEALVASPRAEAGGAPGPESPDKGALARLRETRSRRLLLGLLLALCAVAGVFFDAELPLTWGVAAAALAAAAVAGWRLPPRCAAGYGYIAAAALLFAAGAGLKPALLPPPAPIPPLAPLLRTERVSLLPGETRELRLDTAGLRALRTETGADTVRSGRGIEVALDSAKACVVLCAPAPVSPGADTFRVYAHYAGRPGADTLLIVAEALPPEPDKPADEAPRALSIPFPHSPQDLAVDPAEAARAAFYRRWQWPLKGLFWALITLALWAWMRWREYRRARIVAELERQDKPPYVWRIETGEENLNPDFGEGLALLLNRLCRRESDDRRRLHLRATVRATARQAGRLRPVFILGSRPPEYLLLIDRYHPDDHRARLFEALYRRLRDADTPVERFFFNGSPMRCVNEQYPPRRRTRLPAPPPSRRPPADCGRRRALPGRRGPDRPPGSSCSAPGAAAPCCLPGPPDSGAHASAPSARY